MNRTHLHQPSLATILLALFACNESGLDALEGTDEEMTDQIHPEEAAASRDTIPTDPGDGQRPTSLVKRSVLNGRRAR